MSPKLSLFVEEGQRIGRGVVLDPEIRVQPYNRRGARLRCDCGNEYVAPLLSLVERNGRINTTSCGCALSDHIRKVAFRGGRKNGHGLAHHPLYGIWTMMLHRCENPDNVRYRHYGGRGIEVCDRWHDLRQFVEDIEREIGPRPSRRHSLDRKDPDSNYEPGKVRWATYSQQNRNRSPRNGRIKGAQFVKQDAFEGVTGCWVARVHLGRFRTEAEAGAVYQRAVDLLEREGILS
jgi:hypothetical protein